MAETIQLSFADGREPFPRMLVRRVEFSTALNELFSLIVELTCVDPGVDPSLVVGQLVSVQLEGEPIVKRIDGMVERITQRSSVVTQGESASLYELHIAPPQRLATLSSGRRVYQSLTTAEIVAATLARHAPRVPTPALKIFGASRKREYCVQYDESDWNFIKRLLAEDHLAAYFDWANDGAFTLTDDLSAAAQALPLPLPYRPSTDLVSTAPHVAQVTTREELRTASVSLRDYDPAHPQLARAVPSGLAGRAQAGTNYAEERQTA